MKRNSIFLFSIIFLFTALLTSCDSVVTVSVKDSGISMSFSAESGNAFSEMIESLGMTEEGESVFNPDEVKDMFVQAGFSNVSTVNTKGKKLCVSFCPNNEATDPVSKSGVVTVNNFNAAKITLDKEILQSLYFTLPSQLQSYVDLFMSPTFTGEEMTDAEYLEIIGSIYGNALADEIKNSNVKFVLSSSSWPVKNFSIPLISILNLIGKIELQG